MLQPQSKLFLKLKLSVILLFNQKATISIKCDSIVMDMHDEKTERQRKSIGYLKSPFIPICTRKP